MTDLQQHSSPQDGSREIEITSDCRPVDALPPISGHWLLRLIGTTFVSLKTRNYRLFWSGQLISLMGTWMQDVALSWFVLVLTGSSLALGLVMAIRFLPTLFLSLFGGVLADRFPKRKTMLIAEGCQMVVALALGVVSVAESPSIAAIYLLVALRGVIDAFEGPVRQAFVYELVGPERVANAVALNSTLFNGARVIGPAIGAAVISGLGITVCFFINSVSFLAVLVALAAIRPAELYALPTRGFAQQEAASTHFASQSQTHKQAAVPRRQMSTGMLMGSKDSAWAQILEGLRYVRRSPQLFLIVILLAAIGTFGYNLQTVLPLVVKDLLQAQASGLALLTTLLGIGSMVAGLFMAWWRRPTQRLLLGAALSFSLFLGGIAWSSSGALTAILVFLLGATGMLFMTTANTRMQVLSETHMRGRVMGLYTLLFFGTTPVGSMTVGVLARLAGVRVMVLVLAGLCLVGTALGAAFGIAHCERESEKRYP